MPKLSGAGMSSVRDTNNMPALRFDMPHSARQQHHRTTS
jgi:hypothetical protein